MRLTWFLRFRWVACQLDELRKCAKLSELRKILKSLPKNLDETYERILLNVDELYKEDVRRVLQWLCFCAQPVTLEEMVEVLAVTFEDRPRFDVDQRYPEPEDILSRCSSLVSLSRTTPRWLDDEDWLDDEARYELTLAHFSVKEYLISDRIRNGAARGYRVTKNRADLFIAQTCLAYLLQFDTRYQWHQFTSFPLAKYAARRWIEHARSQGDSESTDLRPLIMELLQPMKDHYLNWTLLYDIGLSSDGEAPAPLYFCSEMALTETTRLLLQMGADVNTQGGEYGNALQAASSSGHKAIVHLLLEQGADVNAQGGYYGNALQAASRNGHEAIVHLLLDRGVDVNAQGGRYSNALQAASSNGHEGIVHLLLERGVDVNTQGGVYGNALQAASLDGQEAIVRLLLEWGADVNVRGGGSGNPLQAASRNGHETIVRLLLERGADVNAQGGDYGNALQAASRNGHEATARLLLERGADVNAHGGYYGNALQAASSDGHEAIVRLLLEQGADVNAQGGEYGNALQAASRYGHEAIVHLLLDRGADVSTQGGYYGNVLQAASLGGHDVIVHLLLERGVDVNVESDSE
jgi:ankyrin repeat protein